MIVVIPSNRSIRLDYLAPLIDAGARFIVVDDSEGSITMDHPQFRVYSWQDRRKMLGRHDPFFPRRNGACRDFGFYVAWKESDPGEVIIALDDDCRVARPDFAAQVEAALSAAPRPVVSADGRHLNILDLYEDMPPALFPRGFPYSARAGHQGLRLGAAEARTVAFSLGLWTNVFDVNAIDKIKGPAYIHPDARLTHPSVIVAPSHWVSVCSMNMQFRREVLPAVYQLPMHVETMPGWVIDRYGDIWGGFILKMLMDLAGDAMAVGEPMIDHMKEGDYLRNIWQEHTAHLVNDEMIALIAHAGTVIRPAGYVDMMGELAGIVTRAAEDASAMLKPYLRHLGPCLESWATVLR